MKKCRQPDYLTCINCGYCELRLMVERMNRRKRDEYKQIPNWKNDQYYDSEFKKYDTE